MKKENTVKTKNSKKTDELLKFINETMKGKYTDKAPVLVDLKFRRIRIQEQEESYEPVDQDENYLFGSSY